jgi:hypothetical protein
MSSFCISEIRFLIETKTEEEQGEACGHGAKGVKENTSDELGYTFYGFIVMS